MLAATANPFGARGNKKEKERKLIWLNGHWPPSSSIYWRMSRREQTYVYSGPNLNSPMKIEFFLSCNFWNNIRKGVITKRIINVCNSGSWQCPCFSLVWKVAHKGQRRGRLEEYRISPAWGYRTALQASQYFFYLRPPYCYCLYSILLNQKRSSQRKKWNRREIRICICIGCC